MKKSRKFLAVLMSIVMLLGTVSMTAAASYSAYLDEAIIDRYNSIDKVDLTIEQKASLILDKLDVVLDKADIVIDLPLIGTLNLTSVDNALSSIYSITGNWLFGRLTVGDLVVLENNRDEIASVRRASDGNTDLEVITKVVSYLSKCAPDLVDMVDPDSGFSWGIVKGFLPPEFRVILDDIDGFIYETIWNALHPVNTEAMPANTTLDTLVQFLCDNQLGLEEGSARATALGFAGVMPGFTLNITTANAYRAFEEGINQALNAFIVPLLNSGLKTVIRNAVESNEAEGGNLCDVVNVDYVIPEYQFDRTKSIVDQINEILGHAVNNMLIPVNERPEGANQFAWQSTTATGDAYIEVLKSNVRGVLSMIIVSGGETNFKPYEAGTSLKAIGDYIARVAVEEFVKHMDLPTEATMEEVAYLGLRELCASLIPEYYRAPLADTADNEDYRAEIIEIAGDIGAYFLNNSLGIECDLDTTAEEFIVEFLVWSERYIYGLFDATEYDTVKDEFADGTATGWEVLDTILWQIFPKNLLPYETMFADASGAGEASELTFESLLNYILDTIFNFDIDKLVTLFTHKANSDLSKNVRVFIIDWVSNILNGAFTPEGKTSCVPTGITTFDGIINPISNVTTIICNILEKLASDEALQNTVMNFVTMLLGLSDAQTLGNVGLDIADRVNCTSGSIPDNTKLRISNYSNGVNSAWTKPDGTIEQDEMYEIELVSLSNTAGLTANVTAGTKIPANGYVDVTVSGSVAATTEARFDLEYYILDESGARINNGTPLKASVYSNFFTVAGNYEVTTDATGETNKVSFSSFSKYFYTTDVHDVATFSIMATNNGSLFGNAAKDVRRAVITGTLPTGLTANNPESDPIVSLDAASLTVDAYGSVNPYVANVDPDAPQPYGEYNLGIQFEICAKDADSGSLSASQNHIIVVYNDFGLPRVLSDMMAANRQRGDYLDSATEEWNTYWQKITEGYALLHGNPDHTKMFADVNNKDGSENAYAAAVAAIEAAAAALDEKVKPTDATKLAELEAVVETYRSANRNDYLLYSFDRFKDAFDYADSLVKSQVAPEDDETFVAESIPVFDLIYAKNQLALWGSRLRLKPVTTYYLAEEVEKAEAYASDSAVAAEIAVAEGYIANPSSTTQSRVNANRVNLMEAVSAAKASGVTPQVAYLQAVTGKTTVIDNENYLVYGLTQNLTTTTIENWVEAASGYVASFTSSSENKMGTGSSITVRATGTSDVVATYTVIIYCDLDGDGMIGENDYDILYQHLDEETLISENSPAFIAADLNGDGTIDDADYELFNENVNQSNPDGV